MGAASAIVSIGDTGVLNRELSPALSAVWIDRDLSWLDFNDRVLAEALDDRTPLLERAKFLAIFTSNLDEFFMKRIAVLRSRNMTPEQLKLLARIHDRLVESIVRQSDCYRNQLVPKLAENRIYLRRWADLNPAQREELGRYFDSEVSAALTPLVFDPAHPFPFLSNLSTSLAFVLRDPQKEITCYARVKVPSVLKQWVSVATDVPDGQQVFVPLHEVIGGNVSKL